MIDQEIKVFFSYLMFRANGFNTIIVPLFLKNRNGKLFYQSIGVAIVLNGGLRILNALHDIFILANQLMLVFIYLFVPTGCLSLEMYNGLPE